jgi:hypothetical protein
VFNADGNATATNLTFSNYTQPAVCPPGSYCPTGTAYATQFLCPNGTVSNQTQLLSAGQCSPCPAGQYCATPGLQRPTGPCAAGRYCSGGSGTATPAGRGGDQCPAGTYCEAGSGAPTNCPAGTYNPNQGSPAVSSCLACPAGQYCRNEGLVTPSGNCTAGYYCGNGTVEPRDLCPTGFYCPSGSVVPLLCGAGTFQALPGQSACTLCPAGYYCELHSRDLIGSLFAP